MKAREQKKCLLKRWILFCTMLLILFHTIGQNETVYAADAKGRDTNLNQQGQIAGLADPEQPSAADSDWMGVYLYFGEYEQGWFAGREPVKWRILDACTTEYGREEEPTILLLSDQVLAKAEFYSSTDLHLDSADGGNHTDPKKLYPANEYAYSEIRKWLNSEKYEACEESEYFAEGFYQGAFSSGEQNAIAVSTKKAGGQISGYGDNSGLSQKGTCDKVFLLSADEALNPLYGFFPNVHVGMAKSGMLEVSSYAGRYGVAGEKGIGSWWLRSSHPNSSSIVYYVNNQGRIGTTNAGEGSEIGVAPAINLKLSAIAFTHQSSKSKDTAFGMTSVAGKNMEWELALWGGKDFAMSWVGAQERTAILEVDAVGTPDAGVEYTQLSAMLVDGEGTVLSYGKIGNKVEAGKVEIEIPEKIPAGTYGLKVFAEDVNGGGYTDFVSNMAEFKVEVLDAGIVGGMLVQIPTPTIPSGQTPANDSTSKGISPLNPAQTTEPTRMAAETKLPSDEKGKNTEKETPQNSSKPIILALLFILAIAVGCGGGIAGIKWFNKKNRRDKNSNEIEK